MKFLLLTALVAIAITQITARIPKMRPITDEFIDKINSKATTWKAGKNFHHIPDIRSIAGVLPKSLNSVDLPLKKLDYISDDDIPESFNSAEKWSECADVIGHVRDQASCGSCWAIAAVETMSDRICIHSNATKKVSVSANDLMSCCLDCGEGCNGGWLVQAWLYWEKKGIVSGGDYGTDEGCKPYPFAQCDHYISGQYPACGDLEETPACIQKCDTTADYKESLTFGLAIKVNPTEADIQKEIMTNGPVECSFSVYEDFLTYQEGVYQNVEGEFVGGHAVKIVGWGVENGTKYWTIVNSWNSDWGQNGYVKFLRGVNHCNIEQDIMCGIPIF